MTARELSRILLRTPDSDVVLRVSDDWVEVLGVKPTGEHRNAVTLNVTEEMSPGVIGVIVYTG